MHFGDTVTLLSHGIQVSEDEITPIGISHGSVAWARWLPDIRALADKKKDSRPPHLIVSPFSVSAWPALVRLELKLNDKRGAMAAATAALRAHGLNILTIDGTPTGHHHATLSVVGEALPPRKKSTDNVFELAKSWSAADRHFKNNEIWNYCCKQLAPEMLRYSAGLKSAILDANDKHQKETGQGFLRETFSDPSRSRRGVLYSHHELPSDVASLGEVQAMTGVRCTWLQEMAFFWLYHGPRDPDLRLKYNGKTSSLSVISGISTFSDQVAKFVPPVKSVVSLNSFEKYMRVALSEADRWGNTISVAIPFKAELKGGQTTSIGFQHEICKSLEDRYTIRKVAITTSELSESLEAGELRLAVSASPPQHLDNDAMHDILRRIESTPKAVGSHVSISPPASIRRLQSRRLFLSTRYRWLPLSDPRHQMIMDLAMSHGFELVDARGASTVKGFHYEATENISETALGLIQYCDAVIQVIPTWKRDDLQWLLFESGAARALGRPIAVCVECIHSIKPERELGVPAWQEALHVTHGTQLFPFYTDESFESGIHPDDRSIFPDLKAAVREALLPMLAAFQRGPSLGGASNSFEQV